MVIDPVRTSTATRADEFFQIRPGSDVALVLAMIHVLDRDGLIEAEWIEWLAHTYATQRPAAIRVLVGPEHRQHGRSIMRAVAILPAVTGAWRDVGGGLARSTQVYFETALNYPAPPDPPRRTFNMARLGEILTDPSLEPGIAALVVHNSNPAVIVPDQNRVLEGLERNNLFTVVLEQFMTDTARYADIVLPTTTQIEHLDLGIAWGHLYLSLNQPAIDPVGEALPNTEIFRRLAAVMGIGDPALRDDDEALIRQLLDSDHPWLDGVTYEHLVENTWARLKIPPGTRPYVDTAPVTTDGRLHLGAIIHEHGDETPDDAASRGIKDGERVAVFNDRGRLTLACPTTDDVLAGVVAIPFGWLHRHSPQGRAVNALTNPATPSDDMGSAAFHDTLVDIAPATDGTD